MSDTKTPEREPNLRQTRKEMAAMMTDERSCRGVKDRFDQRFYEVGYQPAHVVSMTVAGDNGSAATLAFFGREDDDDAPTVPVQAVELCDIQALRVARDLLWRVWESREKAGKFTGLQAGVIAHAGDLLNDVVQEIVDAEKARR